MLSLNKQLLSGLLFCDDCSCEIEPSIIPLPCFSYAVASLEQCQWKFFEVFSFPAVTPKSF